MTKNNKHSCTYCGAPGNERDHVVPKSYQASNSYEGRTVPSCGECNRTLSNHFLHNIPLRASFLYSEYQKKYKKLLESPDWSDQEIKELGHSLKRRIIALQNKKIMLQRRLQNLNLVSRANEADFKCVTYIF